MKQYRILILIELFSKPVNFLNMFLFKTFAVNEANVEDNYSNKPYVSLESCQVFAWSFFFKIVIEYLVGRYIF